MLRSLRSLGSDRSVGSSLSSAVSSDRSVGSAVGVVWSAVSVLSVLLVLSVLSVVAEVLDSMLTAAAVLTAADPLTDRTAGGHREDGDGRQGKGGGDGGTRPHVHSCGRIAGGQVDRNRQERVAVQADTARPLG